MAFFYFNDSIVTYAMDAVAAYYDAINALLKCVNNFRTKSVEILR